MKSHHGITQGWGYDGGGIVQRPAHASSYHFLSLLLNKLVGLLRSTLHSTLYTFQRKL